MLIVKREIMEQKASNKTSLEYYSHFESHRQHQTELILADCNVQNERLCVLGAGNCYDLDLKLIAQQFREVHLVDIDREAIIKARSRLPAPLAKKIHLHAPIDISCVNKKLEAWRDMKVTPEALMEFPDLGVKSLLKALPAPFDCVVSSCLLSQLLLTYRKIIGDHHPLFQAGLITLVITHLRALVKLSSQEGRAFLVTDISSDEIAPLIEFNAENSGRDYLNLRANANQIFNYLDPELLLNLAAQDPLLASNAIFSTPLKAWLWHNGPLRTFLVYALKITPQKR